uniref:Group XIIA secretory phospholipase A2 n=1 Tax=Steinernema glaseri TaxID=37863 RepID=A0A1I8AGD8_9BILA
MLAGYFLLVSVALATAAIKDPDLYLEKNKLIRHPRYPVESFMNFNIAERISEAYKTVKQSFKYKDFECGTTPLIDLLMHASVTRICNSVKYDAVIACCHAHRNCYEQHGGRKSCDDDYCHCLEKAQEKREKNESHCGKVLRGMCAVSVAFGEAFYDKNSISA